MCACIRRVGFSGAATGELRADSLEDPDAVQPVCVDVSVQASRLLIGTGGDNGTYNHPRSLSI